MFRALPSGCRAGAIQLSQLISQRNWSQLSNLQWYFILIAYDTQQFVSEISFYTNEKMLVNVLFLFLFHFFFRKGRISSIL